MLFNAKIIIKSSVTFLRLAVFGFPHDYTGPPSERVGCWGGQLSSGVCVCRGEQTDSAYKKLMYNHIYKHIFIIKGFRTIVFIFIVISTTF